MATIKLVLPSAPIIKRGRGRPRKVKAEAHEEPPQETKRGRKACNKPVPVEVVAPSETTEIEPAKRGGRKLVASISMADSRDGVFFPRKDDTYIIDPKVEAMFKVLIEAVKNSPQNVRVSGPHGCGKTELVLQFAAEYSLPVLIMDCANLKEPRDWFGYKTAENGQVKWVESLFDKAVTRGNLVVLLDELTRTPPMVLNTLMPLLDDRRFTYLEEKGSVLKVGPGTFFFATMNEGIGYSGTMNLDFAIKDRFTRVIEMDFLKPDDEKTLLMKRTGIEEKAATDLVEIANQIRSKSRGLGENEYSTSISTRQLLQAAFDYNVGGPSTLTYTIVNHFNGDDAVKSERASVITMIQGKFGALSPEAKIAGKKSTPDEVANMLFGKTAT